MRKRKQGKIGFYIPRAWLVKAMSHWAKEVGKVQRQKNIEIAALKDEIKNLKEKVKQYERIHNS